MRRGNLPFKKDVDGVKILGEYDILDAVHLVGTDEEVFDEWFVLVQFTCYSASLFVPLYQEIATPFCGMARNDMVVDSLMQSRNCYDKRSFTAHSTS